MWQPSKQPADERSPNYYDDLFSERIRQISKPGRWTFSPPAGRGAGIGIGAVIALVFVVLRVGLALHEPAPRSSRDAPLAQAREAPPSENDDRVNELIEQMDQAEREGRPMLRDRQRQMLEQMTRHLQGTDTSWRLPQPHPEAFLFQPEDIPSLRGLCYRIERDSRQPRPSPGGRIWRQLDAAERQQVHLAAVTPRLGSAGRQRVLKVLNRALREPELYHPDAFRDVTLAPGLRGLAVQGIEGMAPQDDGEIIPLNRWLLEAAYREQILPQRFRHSQRQRQRWQRRAEDDLARALRETERRLP